MRNKKHLVFRCNVKQCIACGSNVAWVKTKDGNSYLVDVEFDERQQDWFYKSYGNHYNLRVAHDCIGEQVKFLDQAKFDLERLGERFGVPMEFDGHNEAGERDGAAIKAAWIEKRDQLARFIKDPAKLDGHYDLFIDKIYDAKARNVQRRDYIKTIAEREARIAEMKSKIAAAGRVN